MRSQNPRTHPTCQLDFLSLQGRLPMYLPSISLKARAPSTASEKLTKPYPAQARACDRRGMYVSSTHTRAHSGTCTHTQAPCTAVHASTYMHTQTHTHTRRHTSHTHTHARTTHALAVRRCTRPACSRLDRDAHSACHPFPPSSPNVHLTQQAGIACRGACLRTRACVCVYGGGGVVCVCVCLYACVRACVRLC